jgi:hypothetical protein
MKCQTCGAELAPGMLFCPNCGTRVAPAPEADASARAEERTDEAPETAGADEYTSGGPRMYDAPDSAVPPVAAQPTVQLAPEQEPVAAPPPPAPAPPYYAPQPTYASGAPAALPTSTTAIVSLIFGILSYVMLPVLGPIVAIVAGHMAKNEIRRSNGQLGGSGMATAGLVLGYLQVVLLLLGVCAFIGFITIAALSSAR